MIGKETRIALNRAGWREQNGRWYIGEITPVSFGEAAASLWDRGNIYGGGKSGGTMHNLMIDIASVRQTSKNKH